MLFIVCVISYLVNLFIYTVDGKMFYVTYNIDSTSLFIIDSVVNSMKNHTNNKFDVWSKW